MQIITKKYCVFSRVIENLFKNKFNNNILEISFYYKLTFIGELDTNDFTLMENDKGNIIKLDFKWLDLKNIKL